MNLEPLLHISWGNINSGSQAIANYITNNEKIEVAISMQEDVIAASLVTTILDIPLCIAHLNNKQNGLIVDCLPRIDTPIRSGRGDQPTLPTIAIISTLIDNIRNVNDLVAYYQKQGHKVKTFSVYSRKAIDNPADYNWIYLHKATGYVFPWQQK